MKNSMQVAMYYSNQDIRLEEMPIPQIGPGELLVKILSSGICGSDLMEWYRIKKAPRVLGHEIAGEIAAVGAGVDSYKIGDRVFVSHHVPCNKCRYCLNNYHTLCDTLRTTNFDPGGFAEYIRVPRINVDRGVFVLPGELSFEEGVFIEPLACIIRGQRMARAKPGQVVLVIGSGMAGIIHVAVASRWGAKRVIAVDISEHRLQIARQFGADALIFAGKDLSAEVKRINGNRLADLVIVCTGAQSAMTQALQCVDRGGTVLFFAPLEPGTKFPLHFYDFWNNGITLMSSYGGAPLDITRSIEFIQTKKIPVKDMVTHRLKLADIALGFKLALEAKESLKVVIEPHGKE